MNVGELRWLLRDVDPSTEVSLFIAGTQIQEGDTYAYLDTINYEDVEKHQTIYLEAHEW